MIEIRPIERKDIPRIHEIASEMWGGSVIAVHLELYDIDDLPGFAAFMEDVIAGFLHYEIKGDSCEILTLASLHERQGIGTALIDAIEDLARSKGCTHLHLITTNDNLHAVSFYQRRGFHLNQVFPGRVDQARKIKPSIPEIGENGIPIRDEIRLEKDLIPLRTDKGSI